MPMQLIPNARQVLLHSYSQRAQGAALAIIGGYQMLPRDWQEALPLGLILGLASVALLLGIVGRLIAQPGLQPAPEADPHATQEPQP